MEIRDVSALLPHDVYHVSESQIELIDGQIKDRSWFCRSERGNAATVFCEKCGGWHEVKGRRNLPEHKHMWSCPHCKQETVAQSLRRSHTDLYDDLLVTLYDLGSDGQTLIARTFYCVRDHSGEAWLCEDDVETWDPRDVTTQIMLYGVCVMNYEKKQTLRWSMEGIYTYKTDAARKRWQPTLLGDCCFSGPAGRLIKRKTFASNMRNVCTKAQGFMGGMAKHGVNVTAFSGELDYALRDTRLGAIFDDLLEEIDGANTYVQDYNGGHNAVSPDFTEELGAICKYHAIEYLLKLDMPTIAVRKACGIPMQQYQFNWRGKTAAAVLRIPQSEIRAARTAGVEITPEYLNVRAALVKNGVNAKPEEILAVRRAGVDDMEINTMAKRFNGGRRARALRYCMKTAAKGRGGWRDIRDYWSECAELGANLNEDDVAFPKNLMDLHERNRQRINAKKYAGADEQILKNLPHMQRFAFTFGGLILRPAESANEVIHEGEALRHCVATYVERYAKESTGIFVLRRAEEPETPWRTVEIDPKSGRVIQDRGYRNDMGGMPKELDERLSAFWAAYREDKKIQTIREAV